MIDMKITQHASDALRNLIGSHLISLSSNFSMSREFASQQLTISSDATNVNLLLNLEELNFEGFEDEYCHFDAAETSLGSPSAKQKGHLFFEGKGQLINEIWVVRDQIIAHHNSQLAFTLETDSTIALRLDDRWLAFSHVYTVFNAIDINFGPTREDLPLRDPSDNWTSDLVDTYEFTREWIQL